MKWQLNHKVHGDKPWAVQTEAMRRSEGKSHYGYFLEQGLGKTPLAFNDYINADDVDLLIVIAPNSFKMDWTFVPELWGRPDIRSGMWPRDPLPHKWEVGVYSLHYECARSDVHKEILELLENRRCMLCIDEGTAIKNYASKLGKGTLEFAKRAKQVRLLDGTPMAQNVMDYYPKLRCLRQLNGWEPKRFQNTFARMGGYMGQQVKGVEREEELAEILDGCSFRALKKDWRKDLPPQIVVDPIHLEMGDRQRRHYVEMMEDFYTMVNTLEVDAQMTITQMDKLRQISSGLLMNRGEYEWIVPPDDNPKVEALFDLHDNREGKTVAVYVYKESGKMLFEEATRRGLQPAWIRGRMKPEEVIEEKRRFNEDPGCRMMIGQEDAACRGHDFLGSDGRDRCNKMVFFENTFAWWQRSQMQDRNHRGVQDQECNIYDLATSPMDLKAIDILCTKRDLADGMDQIVKMVRERRF